MARPYIKIVRSLPVRGDRTNKFINLLPLAGLVAHQMHNRSSLTNFYRAAIKKITNKSRREKSHQSGDFDGFYSFSWGER